MRTIQETENKITNEQLCLQYQQGDSNAVGRLIRRNYALIRAIIRQVRRTYGCAFLEQEDLESAGVLGLMESAKSYCSAKGDRFSTYAYYYIMKSVQREVMQNASSVSISCFAFERIKKVYYYRNRFPETQDQMLAQYIEQQEQADSGIKKEQVLAIMQVMRDVLSMKSLNEEIGSDEKAEQLQFVADSSQPCPDEMVEERMLQYEILRVLSKRERSVLDMRLGLQSGQKMTLQEVSDAVGVTKERVRQIEKGALNKLRNSYVA